MPDILDELYPSPPVEEFDPDAFYGQPKVEPAATDYIPVEAKNTAQSLMRGGLPDEGLSKYVVSPTQGRESNVAPEPNASAINEHLDKYGNLSDVKERLQKQFPDYQFDEKAYREEVAKAYKAQRLKYHEAIASQPETDSTSAVVSRIPFVHKALEYAVSKDLNEALARERDNKATEADYKTIAEHLVRAKRENDQSTLDRIGSMVSHLPTVAAEWMAGGAIAKPIVGALGAAAGRGLGLAAEAIPTGVGTAARIGTEAALRTAADPLAIVAGAEGRSTPDLTKGAKGEPVVGPEKPDQTWNAVKSSLITNAVFTTVGGVPGTTGRALAPSLATSIGGMEADAELQRAFDLAQQGSSVGGVIRGEKDAFRDLFVKVAGVGIFEALTHTAGALRKAGIDPASEQGQKALSDAADTHMNALVEQKVQQAMKGGMSRAEATSLIQAGVRAGQAGHPAETAWAPPTKNIETAATAKAALSPESADTGNRPGTVPKVPDATEQGGATNAVEPKKTLLQKIRERQEAQGIVPTGPDAAGSERPIFGPEPPPKQIREVLIGPGDVVEGPEPPPPEKKLTGRAKKEADEAEKAARQNVLRERAAKVETSELSAVEEGKSRPLGEVSQPETTPKGLREKAQKWGDDAAAEIAKKYGGDKLFSGFDPTDIPLFAKYAAGKIITAGYKFADFVKDITAKFGESVKPHLQAIWDQANEHAKTQGWKEPEPPSETTGPKHAVLDKELADMGFGPATRADKTAFEPEWEKAKATAKADPDAGRRLLTDLAANNRAASPEEKALLTHELNRRIVERDAAQEQFTKAKTPEEMASANARIDAAKAEYKQAADIVAKQGSAAGQSLVFQKMMANRDFTLAAMERSAEEVATKAKKAPLTEEERAKVSTEAAAANKKIQELQAKLDAAEAISNRRKVEDQILGKRLRSAAAREEVDAAWENFAKVTKGKLFSVEAVPELAGAAIRLAKAYVKYGAAKLSDFMAVVNKQIDLTDEQRKVFEDAWEKAKAEPAEAAKPKIVKIGDVTKPLSVSRAAQALAKQFVESGIKDRDALIDAVHKELQKSIPDMTRREAMDAISGYGIYTPLNKAQTAAELRDLKGQMQQVGKLEDMGAGKAPLKTGVERRTPSDLERRLISQVGEAKKKGGFDVTDPEKQLKTFLDTAKTRLKHQIDDLQSQIDKGEKIVKDKRTPEYDAEAKRLVAERDALKEKFDSIFGGNEKTDAQRLEEFKKRTSDRIAELNARTAAGDFAKPEPRKTLGLDDDAYRLKVALERAKQEWQQGLADKEKAARPGWVKAMDKAVDVERFNMLSGITGVGKIGLNVASRVILGPLRQAVSGAIGTVTGVKGPRWGTFNPATELAAITTGLARGWENFKTRGPWGSGQSPSDILYGEHKYPRTPGKLGRVLSAPGELHGAEKGILHGNEMVRSERMREDYYRKQGLDVNSAEMRDRIGREAYHDAEEATLMKGPGDWLTDKINGALNELRTPDKAGNYDPTKYTAGTLAKMNLPIVRVPLNYFGERLRDIFGLGTGGVGLINAYRKGVANLTPEAKDLINKRLTDGSIGAVMLTMGATGLISVANLPRWAKHSPALAMIEAGETAAEEAKKIKQGERQGWSMGIAAALMHLASETPIVREMHLADKFLHPETMGAAIGEMVKSMAIPQLVQYLARKMDSDSKGQPKPRRTNTFMSTIKEGLPGYRQTLDEKQVRPK